MYQLNRLAFVSKCLLSCANSLTVRGRFCKSASLPCPNQLHHCSTIVCRISCRGRPIHWADHGLCCRVPRGNAKGFSSRSLSKFRFALWSCNSVISSLCLLEKFVLEIKQYQPNHLSFYPTLPLRVRVRIRARTRVTARVRVGGSCIIKVTSVSCRPTHDRCVGRASVVRRSSVGPASADARPMSVERRSSVGRASVDARPTHDRYLTDARLKM